MTRHVTAIICTAWIAVWFAWWWPAVGTLPMREAGTPVPTKSATPVPTLVTSYGIKNARATLATTSISGRERRTATEPGIPAIVDILYLGVPAGNGHIPYQVAVDSQRRRAYTLNYGTAASGNTISVLDLETAEITALIHLDNMGAEDFSPPDPLDLQVDPYRPRLYALWGDRYAEITHSTLTIIDAEALSVIDTVPGVEAIAAGPDRLYLANDTRVWGADPDSLAELEGRDLDPRRFNEPLLLDPQARRLYLGRGRPWSLEIFEADSLEPVGSYPKPNKVTPALVDADGGRLFILENDGDQVFLRAMNADGRPLADPPPLPLADDLYSDLPMAFLQGGATGDGQVLYVAVGEYGNYRLDAFGLPNLTPVHSLPLSSKPHYLAIDPVTGLLYATYGTGSSYVLAIDPITGPAEVIHTALTISDALADPGLGRLYVLDDGGTLRALSLADNSQIARTETGFNFLNGRYSGYGQLSLDPRRSRLYIGGEPVRIVDTDLLQVTAHLDGRGQVSPDPTSDRLYLTPPCLCRLEQCNTLILSAGTLTGTQSIFPHEDPFTAPCVVATSLDSENQLLYAQIYNGTPGSNSGNYYFVFDVSGQPEKIYTAYDISYGSVAIDPRHQRAFAPRYRIDRSFIHRFEARGDAFTQTLTLAGAYGQLVYDPDYDRLYVEQEDRLQVFDGDLTLLADISLPGEFELLTFDSQGQRLYMGDSNGNLLVVATGGGQLEPPAPVAPDTDQAQIQQILAAPDGTLFRVFDHRLYRSDDGGQVWKLLGRGLPGRPIGDLGISPEYERDQTLLAGLWDFGHGGGLYRSTDGGDTWRPTTQGLTDLEISDIVFSPTYLRDRTIFLTTLGHGLFRSTNGGDTWTSLSPGYAADPYDLEVLHTAVSPTFADDGLIIISKNHLLRSTDGGKSWVDTGIPGGLVAFSPNYSNDKLILSSGHWLSPDEGRTWQPAAVGREPGLAQDLFFSPTFATDGSVYLLLKKDYDSPLRLQRSVDAGRSWDSLLGGTPAGFELASGTALPSGELRLAATDGRQVTVSAGELTWGRLSIDMTQLDLQALAIAPDGSIFIANSDAGVFKSADGGRSWRETRFPARAHEVLHPAQLTIADDGTLFAAAGMVVARSADGGQTWTHLHGVPAGFEIASLAISPDFAADGVVAIGGNYRNSQILRSDDGGETWEIVFDGKTPENRHVSDMIAVAFSPDFARDRTLYAWLQDSGLLRSTDGGLSWELVAESTYYGQTLALYPTGNRLYLGALYGHTLVSEDGGKTWLDLRDNIPDDRIWSTALAFGEEGTLFLGTDRGVYRSPDEGETWTRASAGLPIRPYEGTPQGVRALRFRDGRLYAALAQGGLFLSDDEGDSWRSSISGQPASPIETAPTPTPGTGPSNRTAIPTPTPPPPVTLIDCAAPPDHFADLWAERVAQLGCPLASHSSPIVEQSFEGGWMFWRSDAAAIYVLPSGQPYARFDDRWDESQPAYSCPDVFPPQTPPTPKRGFGLIWCNEALVRKLLGNVASQERLFDATLQEFDTGLIFKTDQGVTYVLESRMNGWERVK